MVINIPPASLARHASWFVWVWQVTPEQAGTIWKQCATGPLTGANQNIFINQHKCYVAHRISQQIHRRQEQYIDRENVLERMH